VNLSEHSRRESSRDAGTAVLVAGSEGFYKFVSSPTAQAQLGWRAEVGADAGQLNSQAAVDAVASTFLATASAGVAEYAAAVEFGPGAAIPLIDYGVGDWAYTIAGTTRRRLRIAQLELVFGRDKPADGKAVFNDLITDQITKLTRKLNAISTGDAVVGTSESTPGGAGADTIPPAAPVGLTVSSSFAYQVPGEPITRAEISAGWQAVTTNAYSDGETSGKALAARLIAERISGGAATEEGNNAKAEAARLVRNRIESNQSIFEDWTWSGAPSVVGQYNDVLLAEFASARPDAYAARLILSRLESGAGIFEDWTWPGAPAVVGQYNDELLADFIRVHPGVSTVGATARSALQGFIRSNALVWLDRASGSSGGAIFEDLTWSGAPSVVGQYNDVLLEEWKASPGYPEDFLGRTIWDLILPWLLAYPDDHTGGGTVTDDVDHYRVQYVYLGGTNTNPGQIPPDELEFRRLTGITSDDAGWIEAPTSPTTATFTVFGEIIGGRAVGVRVCAVDRSGNQGPWSAVVGVMTAVDDVPPPVPSRPIAVPWFETMNVTWDGKGSAGEDMIAAAVDFLSGGALEVHVALGIDFTPHRPSGANGKVDLSLSTTYKTSLYNAGTTNIADLSIGTTYFVRFVAVDRNGNASEPSATSDAVSPQQLVNIQIGPNAIARAQIIDGEIVTAKIADLAVNDAKVSNLSVGKLTAGTMTANVVIGGRFETPINNGNQVQLDAAGLRMYRGGTVIGRWQVADSSMLMTGQFQSNITGQRIVINPGGGNPDTMRFYPTSTEVFSSIDSVSFNNGSVAGIRIVGSGTDATANRGMVLVRDQYASLVHGRTDLSYWGIGDLGRAELHAQQGGHGRPGGGRAAHPDRRRAPGRDDPLRQQWVPDQRDRPVLQEDRSSRAASRSSTATARTSPSCSPRASSRSATTRTGTGGASRPPATR
jgi:hypothetical protein